MNKQYAQVASAIEYLVSNASEQPSLQDVSAAVHCSPYHFQRKFSALVGLSPKQFLQYVTALRAGELLTSGESLAEATAAVGLSGSSRLHDHFIKLLAMTPGEFQRGGDGLAIQYARFDSLFGQMLIAATSRGICHLSFVVGEYEVALSELKMRWPKAAWQENSAALRPFVLQLFSRESGGEPLHIHALGTNFQIQVWQALLSIPRGELWSYSRLAQAIDQPKATRAVASAVAANSIAWLIPCHRVIRNTGLVGQYRWGSERKTALLAWEEAVLLRA